MDPPHPFHRLFFFFFLFLSSISSSLHPFISSIYLDSSGYLAVSLSIIPSWMQFSPFHEIYHRLSKPLKATVALFTRSSSLPPPHVAIIPPIIHHSPYSTTR